VVLVVLVALGAGCWVLGLEREDDDGGVVWCSVMLRGGASSVVQWCRVCVLKRRPEHSA